MDQLALSATPKPSAHFCFLQPDGCEQVLSAAAARDLFAVDGFLRADAREHERAQGRTLLWYFNIGLTTHQLGHVYGMTPVLRPGRRASNTEAEVLPLLCGKTLTRYRCVDLAWHPEFPVHLSDDVLLNSLLDDKTLQGLQQALVRRYAPAARDALTVASVLGKGLTATLLERQG